jgi:ferritin
MERSAELMAIKKKILNAIHDQINAELYSAYMYLSMSAYFESINLPGFAHWMKVQWQEEIGHADKFFKYLCDRGGRVTLKVIEQPPAQWKSPLDVFEATLAHEQKVTGLIDDLVALARQEKDNATEILLQWYVTEQVEEEKNAEQLVQQLRAIKDSTGSLFYIDRHLAKRGEGD